MLPNASGRKTALSRRHQKGKKYLVPVLEVQELTGTGKLLGLSRFLFACTFWNSDISAKARHRIKEVRKTGIYKPVIGHKNKPIELKAGLGWRNVKQAKIGQVWGGYFLGFLIYFCLFVLREANEEHPFRRQAFLGLPSVVGATSLDSWGILGAAEMCLGRVGLASGNSPQRPH